MEIGLVCSWIYCVIAIIVFKWLSEHFYIEEIKSKEEYMMHESVRCMVIGSMMAIGWIAFIPMIIMGGRK